MFRIAATLVGAAALVFVGQAHAAGFAVQTYDVPGSNPNSTLIYGVNNAGVMVGQAAFADGYYAVEVDHGVVTRLSGPGGSLGTFGADINDSGMVVGDFWTTTVSDPGTGDVYPGPSSTFIYDGSGYSTFSIQGYETQARGLSPDGRFVSGIYFNETESGAFVYDTTGVMPLQKFDTPLSMIGQGINASNIMVGSEFVGDDINGYTKVGFTYDLLSGERHDYGFAGYAGTAFRDITSDGRIGGYLHPFGLDGVSSVGFFGTPDNFETFMVPGAMDTIVEGVNDEGMVVGVYTNADGTSGSFIATPVPEPATWALSLAGLLSIGLLRRRRA